MATITNQEWNIIHQAAKEYARYAPQVEQVRNDIKLYKRGIKKITDISNNKFRVQARINQEREMLHDQTVSLEMLERVINNADFQDAVILNKLVAYARAVGRIVVGDGSFGTGWLIGENLLITNHHVLPNAQVAAHSFVNLGYERTMDGYPQNGEIFRLKPEVFFMTPKETSGIENFDFLDFTVVAVEPVNYHGKALADFGYVVLEERIGKIIEGENCMVIQHPEGGFKKVVMREIRLLAIEDEPDADKHLIYESDTLPGSSGGMVVALGTGKIIALHHASVPRMDAHGRYLKKDGNPWKPGEPDDLIDWTANKGVRVSKIIEAIRTLPLPASMEQKRRDLLSVMELVKDKDRKNGQLPEPAAVASPTSSTSMKEDSATQPVPVKQYFLVKTSTLPVIREYVISQLKENFKNCEIRRLDGAEEDMLMEAYLDVAIHGTEDPWELARHLETIDGIEEAEPDLPRFTTIGATEGLAQDRKDYEDKPTVKESGRGGDKNDLAGWVNSPHLRGLDRSKPSDLAKIRRWNHRAVNFSEEAVAALLGEAGLHELGKLRLAQFDTGYTSHSKVKEGFRDTGFDAVDGDFIPLDEEAKGFTHYGHGTRTGSIVVGAPISEVNIEREGNVGLLRAMYFNGYKKVLLTPYRVAKSVVLLGRIRDLIVACSKALHAGHHVMTMSMGILPGTSALHDLVRTVYERGVIWCCAAGNEVRTVVAPGKYPGVICVAASNPDDAPWRGSCRGAAVDITAPGEDIYVPIEKDGVEDMNYGNGTSYATPHVASAAMLWLAKNKREIEQLYTQPWQKVEAFRYCLQVSSRPSDKLPKGKFGAGILDIEKLLHTPLPKASSLRHAYVGVAGLEHLAARKPVALRELEYKDWSLYYRESLLDEEAAAAPLLEKASAAQAIERSVGAQHLAAALATQLAPSLNESMKDPLSPEAALERLNVLAEMEEVAKPLYEKQDNLDLISPEILLV